MKSFREIVNENTSTTKKVFDESLYRTSYLQNEGFFSKLKNKLKYAGNELGEDKHYYEDGRRGLKARISIIDYNTGEDYIKFQREDIITGKKTEHETTLDSWFNELDFTGGWLEYSDEEQGRAFKFIQSVYNKDTKVILRAGTKYIFDDFEKVTGKNKEFVIKKQKFNKDIKLVEFQGYTTNGEQISFDPTRIVK